ncbi:hypothetical protein HWQ46_00550 [Shewanella sp. D64]|uniref:hypothetical protein n=1 Tax=unclassified Shewanella TaxID=196818 RepID=UPI0022BA1FD0|nr:MULTISPECIES: hypothetical protein [unclassified Shewanella]MEC4724039.1 hypothetical protein [Shewanella sp. D64]MEC4736059.1 hypothetical protein [Shewanella sp. E94]WBJ97996.1 hypothetical protein HWQ47_13305 [Shewanella sp. MTB7]
MNYKQVWVYQGETPKAGRRLLLLQPDELTIALPLIYRLIHPNEISKKQDWFYAGLAANHNQKYIALVPQLQQVTQMRKELDSVIPALRILNESLNHYFSDYGWRMVRKELSQIKKRQRKAHIELSKDIILKLKLYMEEEKFESFDQAIDNLIAEAKYKKRES